MAAVVVCCLLLLFILWHYSPTHPPTFYRQSPMYIEKHPKGYRCHVQKNGQRKSAVWPTKREAQDWGRMVEQEFAHPKPPPPAGDVHTFGQAVDRYIKDVSAKKEGKHFEELRLAAALVHFGDVPLSSIRQPEIAAWRDKRLETVIGSTVQRERNLLRNLFLKAWKEWHWCEHNPFADVEMPAGNEARTAIWCWQDIRAMLRFLGYQRGVKPETDYQQVALAFMIGLHTSLRAREILRVNKDTLNPTTRVIRVKTKTMKLAQVPITRRALKVCLLADFTIDATNLDALFRKAKRACMIGDFTFHDSRAFALTMLAKRVDLKTLARISQHKDINMLMRYFRESTESIAGRI